MCVLRIKPVFVPVDMASSTARVRADSSSYRDASSVVTELRHRDAAGTS